MTIPPIYLTDTLSDWETTDRPYHIISNIPPMGMSPIPVPSMYFITPEGVEIRTPNIKGHKLKVKKHNEKYRIKNLTKNKAKKAIKTKFKIGRYYFLRFKPRDGSEDVVIKYQCKKTIYSVNDIVMNIVIMKQITPFDGRKFTLDKHECEKFHIKFETGLEVWPMTMNWIPEKKTA